jgi:hypothetical protein
MAYREFYKGIDTVDIDYSPIERGVTNLLRSVTAQQQAKRDAANQFKYDLDQGAFENDTKILNEVAKNVTDRARTELKQSGRVTLDTEKLMKDGLAFQQASKNQLERAKALRQNITDRATKDPYYNPEIDLGLVTEATHGKDNDKDFRTRGESLAEAEKRVGSIDSFMFNKYRADYVKNIGAQFKEKTTGTPNAKSTIYNQATFWDDKTGKPGVTDDQAIDFLESDRRVNEFYDSKVNKDLSDEIKKMKSSGDERTAWMSGLSEAEIKNELINNPSKNLINPTDFGVRVRDLAKKDLSEADRINSKVTSDYSGDKNLSGGGWSNQNILKTDSINGVAQTARDVGTRAEKVFTAYGPGGRITQKSGRPIQLNTTNPIRSDITKGVTTRNNTGNLALNMTGYQLMPVKKGFAPFALQSNTVDGMIQEINNLPNDYFDPNGKIGLQPSLKIGLNGYTTNEANVLNDVNDKMFDIADQIKVAKDANDKDKLASLQDMEYSLNEIKDMIGAGNYDERDLLFAANKAGIKKVKEDWIIPADNSDLANIRNITGGLDLNDKNNWSNEMKLLDAAYAKKYQEAQAAGFKAPQEATPAKGKAKAKVTTTLKDSYTINGKGYSLDALKKLGYTDDQIMEAVRLGTIK